MTKSVYIDVESALDRVGGNETLLKRLLGKFEHSVDMTGFTAAIDAADCDRAGEIVHTAKGLAGNLSLTAFFETSSRLMDQFRSGMIPDEAELRRFHDVFKETKTAIRAYLDQ
jgi:HPt (histidine-containing phosphotransfer) domain-containing protein